MLKKLKIKFVAVTMALVTGMLCVILGMVLIFTEASLERDSYQRLQNPAAQDFHPGRPGEGTGVAGFTMVITARGDLIVSGSSYYDLTDQEYLLRLAQKVLAEDEPMGKLPRYGLRYYREETLGGFRICFADISQEKQMMQRLWVGCIGVGFASLVVFFLLSLLLARWMVRPVERAWEQQKQFVADASHELKTPLTVITTNAELLLQEDGQPEEKRKFSGNILAMAQQMRHLVEGMLELARGDAASMKMSFAPVALSELVEACCLVFEPVAYERGLALEAAVMPGVCVQGSEEHLRQVVEVLLDNGVKYSAPPGTIRVWMGAQGRECCLTVENPGPQISGEDLQKIFHRFYRTDAARTGGSFGLGLPIAQGIVQAHGGRIWAGSQNGVNRFVVQLPLGRG